MYNGVIIKISRRNVELARQITGIMLLAYVAIWILAGVFIDGILDAQLADTIQTTLYLPTAIALVAYILFSIKSELDKPKNRSLSKNMPYIYFLVAICGLLFILAIIYFEYLI